MPPAYSANLVANSGNTIYGVSVIHTNQVSVLLWCPITKKPCFLIQPLEQEDRNENVWMWICRIMYISHFEQTSNGHWRNGITGRMSGTVHFAFFYGEAFIIPQHNEVVEGGGGKLVSLRPSIPPSVHPSTPHAESRIRHEHVACITFVMLNILNQNLVGEIK